MIVKETSKHVYNVRFESVEHQRVEFGIISEDRLRVSCGGGPYGFTFSLEWVGEKTAENIRKRFDLFLIL